MLITLCWNRIFLPYICGQKSLTPFLPLPMKSNKNIVSEPAWSEVAKNHFRRDNFLSVGQNPDRRDLLTNANIAKIAKIYVSTFFSS